MFKSMFINCLLISKCNLVAIIIVIHLVLYILFLYPQVHRDEREKTVERIWGITEQLNILYRDNWTRLAEQEIAHFQDLLLKKIYEDMIPNQHAGTFTVPTNNDGPMERKVPEYEWNFAKAFLYSLTVITTIGE